MQRVGSKEFLPSRQVEASGILAKEGWVREKLIKGAMVMRHCLLIEYGFLGSFVCFFLSVEVNHQIIQLYLEVKKK